MPAQASIHERILDAATRTRDWANATAGPHGFELTRPELFVPELHPAHDGLRVAQLSDIHVGMNTPDERVRAAVREVNTFAPDIVFLTGDFVTYSKRPVPLVRDLLAGIEAPTFAVLGNHDHIVGASEVVASLVPLGYEILRNQHTVVRIKGAPLTVLGIDDGGTWHDDVAATFRGKRPPSARGR
jgi:predicted MPP superfamily phosphohydrolase